MEKNYDELVAIIMVVLGGVLAIVGLGIGETSNVYWSVSIICLTLAFVINKFNLITKLWKKITNAVQ